MEWSRDSQKALGKKMFSHSPAYTKLLVFFFFFFFLLLYGGPVYLRNQNQL